jgi:phosphopantothenoylcysteine decarboxylase/phosphopantothenate--cysteine ligase
MSAAAAEKRRVVLGITGSIAAYKAAELARYMITRGYSVRVVMSESACRFISPLTFEAITGHPVMTEFWNETQPGAISHIALADWAELLLIAPASADFIAKLTHGHADSPVLAVALATKAPVLVAPTMNVNMYQHPQTQANVAQLKGRGVLLVAPDSGALACGWEGQGRLPHHREIFFHVRRALTHHDFSGRRILITAGPTREAIDPVRYISNRSSGRMGMALAVEGFRRGAHVTLVHGPLGAQMKVPREVERVSVVTAEQMHAAVMGRIFPTAAPTGTAATPYDIVIMAAAVADYRAEQERSMKQKKVAAPEPIAVRSNPDILFDLGARRAQLLGESARQPILVGFALETGEVEDLVVEVRRKLEHKRADLMVGNRAEEAFEGDTNRVWLINRSGREQEVATTYKSRIAVRIFDAIAGLF